MTKVIRHARVVCLNAEAPIVPTARSAPVSGKTSLRSAAACSTALVQGCLQAIDNLQARSCSCAKKGTRCVENLCLLMVAYTH